MLFCKIAVSGSVSRRHSSHKRHKPQENQSALNRNTMYMFIRQSFVEG